MPLLRDNATRRAFNVDRSLTGPANRAHYIVALAALVSTKQASRLLVVNDMPAPTFPDMEKP